MRAIFTTFPTHASVRPQSLLALAVLLVSAVVPSHAAQVQVGVSASAIDAPGGFNAVISNVGGGAGMLEGTPPVLSFTTAAAAGIVNTVLTAQANAYTGQIRGNLLSIVGDTVERAGRGGSATAVVSMTGSITLVGSAPPGVATFSGVVEGAYNFGTATERYRNTGYIEADGIIGDVYSETFRQNFDPRTGAGLFAFPLSWTVAVQPGQRLDMSFNLRAYVASTVDIAAIDFGNTFKLTTIDLPAGYTYTPDAQGFLSQFTPTPVPEPASGALLLAGMAALAWRLCRQRQA